MKEDRLNGLALMMVHRTDHLCFSREHHWHICGKASSKNAIGTYIALCHNHCYECCVDNTCAHHFVFTVVCGWKLHVGL